MFCFKFSHFRDLMILQGQVALGEQKLELARLRIEELDRQRNALIAENNELILRMSEMDQLVNALRRTTSGEAGVAMPSQARDWKFVADTMQARAELDSYQKK